LVNEKTTNSWENYTLTNSNKKTLRKRTKEGKDRDGGYNAVRMTQQGKTVTLLRNTTYR